MQSASSLLWPWKEPLCVWVAVQVYDTHIEFFTCTMGCANNATVEHLGAEVNFITRNTELEN